MQHDLFPFLSSLLPALEAIETDSWTSVSCIFWYGADF